MKVNHFIYSGALVLKYALILQDKAMFQVNMAAIVLNVMYLICYYIYCKYKWEDLYKPCLRGMGLIAAISMYLRWEDPSKLEYRYGLLVTVLMLLLMGSPLMEIVSYIFRIILEEFLLWIYYLERNFEKWRCFQYSFSYNIYGFLCINSVVFVWYYFIEWIYDGNYIINWFLF